ncbi:29eadc97-5eac-4f09-9910-fe91f61479a3 [Thermothielavioides terrestris]|uniref:29eadc97-5eac-4f09-9910-fe91f61479a3 n=1 Tax=Thermothielavioides terrestris TaxID=2587410 RepID=A0A3S4F2Y8_9PEZI|nr:29eadc97-5eac-4f09-9910-fe91f61479a3 [Thermothielavioides terrestris]
MKSWTATARGPPTPQSLTLAASLPLPTLPPNSTALLLKITHVALNPADLVLLRALPPWLPFRRAPPVPGMDFAGVVVAVGDGAGLSSSFAVGDRVCGALGLAAVLRGEGTLAEYVLVESASVAKMPLREGWGLREAVIDYRIHDPLEEHLAQKFGEQQFDAILDCAGSQALFSHSPRYLKPEGKFVSIVGGWSQGVVPFVRNKLRPRFLGGTPRRYDLFLLSSSGSIAKEVAGWVEQGVIKQAVIDSEYPMEQAVEAFQKLATGRARGKIVIKVASTE